MGRQSHESNEGLRSHPLTRSLGPLSGPAPWARSLDSAGIQTMVGCHLDPAKSDEELQALEIEIRRTDICFNFVREGQTFEL